MCQSSLHLRQSYCKDSIIIQGHTAEVAYVEMIVTNENHMPEGIKSRLNLRNYCCFLVHNVLFFPSAVENCEDRKIQKYTLVSYRMPAPHYVMFAYFSHWVYIDKFVLSNDSYEMYQT